jgi:hypothetical protein
VHIIRDFVIEKEMKMSNRNREATKTWPDLAMGLYDRLTGRNAEISYQFEDLEVLVPSNAGSDAEFAQWKINGTLNVRTRDRS